MPHVIENLLGKTVNLDWATTPSTVEAEGRPRRVVASAYLPPSSEGELHAHVVVYNRRYLFSEIVPENKDWAVSLYVQDDDQQQGYLVEGECDLTFAEAMVRFVTRIERQA